MTEKRLPLKVKTKRGIYKVIGVIGDTALLENELDEASPYVVASGLFQDGDNYSWGYGEYYATYKFALRTFKREVKDFDKE